jgi:hypothetical protein
VAQAIGRSSIVVKDAKRGSDTMASWLMIILAYVIIAVGVFNLLGPGSHLLY